MSKNENDEIHNTGNSDVAVLPPEVSEILGKFPILPSENRNRIYRMYLQVLEEVNAKGPIQIILVLEYVMATVEIHRWTRSKAGAIIAMRAPALRKLLLATLDCEHRELVADKLVREFFSGQYSKELQDHLHQYKIDEDAIVAQAQALCISEYSDFDTLQERAERRRSSLLREIEHSQAAFAKRLRKAAEEITLEAREITDLSGATGRTK